MLREIDRPMPMPVVLVVKNGSKMRSICAAGMPVPVSATLISRVAGTQAPGGHRDHAQAGLPSALERIHAVEDEVEKHLLQLHPVAEQPAEGPVRHVELERDVAGRRVRTQQRRHVAEHLRQVEHGFISTSWRRSRARIRSMTAPAR